MSSHKSDDKQSTNEANKPSYQLPKTSLKIPMPKVKYNQIHSVFGDNVAADKTNAGNNYTDTQLNETVEQIKQLIDQLCKNNPINTTTDAMKIATQVIEKIETNINLKQKAIAVSQKGLLQRLKTNPVGAIIVSLIEGWTT